MARQESKDAVAIGEIVDGAWRKRYLISITSGFHSGNHQRLPREVPYNTLDNNLWP